MAAVEADHELERQQWKESMDKLEKKMDELAEEQDVKVRLISLYWTNEINRSSSPLEDSAPKEYSLQLSGDQDWIRICEEGGGKS